LKPFLFLLGLIVVLAGLLGTTIRNQNKLMRRFVGVKQHEVFA
jgi:hypothetical protein